MTDSRLENLTIRDFRSIRGTVYVPLNAPVVLIHGANGAGKSSIMTALEIALTGSSGNLKRADQNYLRHLVHEGCDSAQIELRATIAGTLREVSCKIGGPEPREAMLDPDLIRHFNERNYLPQSTLSRLLEIYQKPNIGTLSPLTRFVNELLGLDRYDALVEGLAQLQDVRNVRKLAPLYADMEDLASSGITRVRDLEASLRKLQTEEATTRSQLAEHLSEIGLGLPDTQDRSGRDRLSAALAAEDGRDLVLTQALFQEAQILEERLKSVLGVPEVANAQEEAEATRASVTRWLESEGAALERSIEQVRVYFPDLPTIRATSPVDAHEAALSRARAEVDRCGAILQRDELARQRTTEIDQALAAARSRLSRLDDQLADVASGDSNSSLATLLSDVMAHIDGQVCPVCDRDFEEEGRGPLDVHVGEKIAQLSLRARELEQLAVARRAASNDVEVQERLGLDQAKNYVSAEARAQLRARAAGLTEAMNALLALSDGARRGQFALQEDSAALNAASRIRERSNDLRNLEGAVQELASRVQGQRSSRDTLDRVLADLLGELDRRIEVSSSRAQSVTSAARSLEVLSVLEDRAADLARNVAKARREQAAAKASIDRATEVRESGKTIAREAQSARTEIVRSIFNDSLNKTWRDLFVRLAPSEPFVPAFRVRSAQDAAAVAQLETVTRAGGRAGSPGTMLSAGNLNTAALTLFLSLHLTSPRKLPWLLLDDPVQSMDDVHTSQFAALLRTLSKQHKRQIIVAVHERALFEYLTLELSPAFPGDELLTLEVTRAQDQDTVVEPRYLRWEEDPAFPVALAAG